eukprot:4556027-Pyramimonas_sp.AAC.1
MIGFSRVSFLTILEYSPIRACLCSGPSGFIYLDGLCRRFPRPALVPGYLGARVPKCPGARVSRCPGARVPGSPIAL